MTTDLSAIAILLLFALLGSVTGVAAAAFISGLHLAEDLFDRISSRYLRHALGMLLVGLLIYALFHAFGHYHVEGVGYATVQAILSGELTTYWLLAILCVCKLLATVLSLGSGSSGGIFSPSLFIGATLGGAFAALLDFTGLPVSLSVPAFAMVGMGAMVGGGTGAVMTAIVMIFEMTLNYNIIMPMIVAVALSVGVRRVLCRENVYTLKLFRRGRSVPKARHANMFLVRRANEVMERDMVVLDATTNLDSFLSRPDNAGRLRHVVVVQKGRISGVIRINTALRRGLESVQGKLTLGEVASREFTIARENDLAFDVINRMWRRNAGMAVVVHGRGIPHGADVIGVISKEHVADSVAASIKIYPSEGV